MVALVDDLAKRRQRGGSGEGGGLDLASLSQLLREPILKELIEIFPSGASRGILAARVKDILLHHLEQEKITLNPLQERNLITVCLNEFLADLAKRSARSCAPAPEPQELPVSPLPAPEAALPLEQAEAAEPEKFEKPSELLAPASDKPVAVSATLADLAGPLLRKRDGDHALVERAAGAVKPLLLDRIDITVAAKMDQANLARAINDLLPDLTRVAGLQLNSREVGAVADLLVHDMLGLGPLEPLLADPAVTDIMVNGPAQIYVERKGKLELTNVTFRDNAHAMAVATRIVSRVGRRVDESTPLCDARLADGSRVNIIIPPLAIDGVSISIRKFSEKKITLDVMAQQNNISQAMKRVLEIASRSRLNILISGGTGSGKTTLLNALSRMIDLGERIVTIEDAAELQLQQPHVVRLETRPPNLEGRGEITMRDLVKNSLRMRPDRVILGEIRGSEAVDMLQAMNTGHDGSMCTVHANNPREALTRLENMVGMAGINLPAKAVRMQIASAIDLIVQISRMRDGKRRIQSITEVVGMEGDIVTTQELFRFRFEGEDAQGNLTGKFESAGLRPHFIEKASYYGLERALIDAVAMPS